MISRRLFNNEVNAAWVAMFISIIFSLLPSQLLLAAGDQLMITTDSTYEMSTGTTFTVGVKAFISSTASPQTAIGNVKYPTSQLRFISAQPGGSGFGNPAVSPPSGGLINFNASRASTGKGIVKIFDITFQAIGAGTAIVEFTGDSLVNQQQTTYKSAVLRITNPTPNPSTAPATPKPTPSVAPSVSPVPVSPTTPTPSNEPDSDTFVPILDPNGVVTNVNIDPDYTKGLITWKVTASNPKSVVMYGIKSSDLNQQAVVTQTPDGTFSSTINGLNPGERYYFTITGSGDGNKNGTYSSTLTTNGFPVRITVTENDIAAKSAQIRINNLNKITDADGKTTIGLAEGEYKGKITTSTASLDITVKVEKKPIPDDGSSPPAQAVSFNLSSSPLEQGPGSGQAILTFVGVLIAGTALMGVGFVGFMAYRRRQFETQHGNNPSTTVIIDDGYSWHEQSQAQTPNTSSLPPQDTIPEAPHHDNSVYIDDEEPVDMFEKK